MNPELSALQRFTEFGHREKRAEAVISMSVDCLVTIGAFAVDDVDIALRELEKRIDDREDAPEQF